MKITRENINDITFVGVVHNGNYHYYIAPRYEVKVGDDVIVEGREIGTVTKTISPYTTDLETFRFFCGDGDYHTIDGVLQKFVYDDEVEDEGNINS